MDATYELFDGMIFQSEEPRGKGGELRESWRLLRRGENRLKKSGHDYVLTLSAEDIASAVSFQASKGEKIPIDSRHALFFAAKAAGLSESEALKQVPGGVAALGFCALGERDGDLWAVDVEWLPLAAEMFRQGMLRYYSPVVRGVDGKSPLRITSVAMDNVPALCDLDVLAASGEVPGHGKERNKEDTMKKLEAALRRLLGDDSLALGAEQDEALAGKVEALATELPELRKQAGTVAALTSEVETLKKKTADAEALVLAAETAKKESLVTEALAAGKICNAQKDLLLKMSSAALAEFLAATPAKAAVPTGKDTVKGDPNTVSLSAEEELAAQKMGVSPAEMLEEKKRQLKLAEGGKA